MANLKEKKEALIKEDQELGLLWEKDIVLAKELFERKRLLQIRKHEIKVMLDLLSELEKGNEDGK